MRSYDLISYRDICTGGVRPPRRGRRGGGGGARGAAPRPPSHPLRHAPSAALSSPDESARPSCGSARDGEALVGYLTLPRRNGGDGGDGGDGSDGDGGDLDEPPLDEMPWEGEDASGDDGSRGLLASRVSGGSLTQVVKGFKQRRELAHLLPKESAMALHARVEGAMASVRRLRNTVTDQA